MRAGTQVFDVCKRHCARPKMPLDCGAVKEHVSEPNQRGALEPELREGGIQRPACAASTRQIMRIYYLNAVVVRAEICLHLLRESAHGNYNAPRFEARDYADRRFHERMGAYRIQGFRKEISDWREALPAPSGETNKLKFAELLHGGPL